MKSFRSRMPSPPVAQSFTLLAPRSVLAAHKLALLTKPSPSRARIATLIRASLIRTSTPPARLTYSLARPSRTSPRPPTCRPRMAARPMETNQIPFLQEARRLQATNLLLVPAPAPSRRSPVPCRRSPVSYPCSPVPSPRSPASSPRVPSPARLADSNSNRRRYSRGEAAEFSINVAQTYSVPSATSFAIHEELSCFIFILFSIFNCFANPPI